MTTRGPGKQDFLPFFAHIGALALIARQWTEMWSVCAAKRLCSV